MCSVPLVRTQFSGDLQQDMFEKGSCLTNVQMSFTLVSSRVLATRHTCYVASSVALTTLPTPGAAVVYIYCSRSSRCVRPPLPLTCQPGLNTHPAALHPARAEAAVLSPALSVLVMFSCRAAWQRCGPLARRAAYRLQRDGEFHPRPPHTHTHTPDTLTRRNVFSISPVLECYVFS